MPLFKVITIIDGYTIKISPNWKWENQEGNTIRIYGYEPPKQGEESIFAKNKLEKLLLNQYVELKDPNNLKGEVLACRIFRNSVDISRYFPEFANF